MKHRRHISHNADGIYAYSCSCGKRDGGYLTKDYAIDGWLEAHDMEPLINYPQV